MKKQRSTINTLKEWRIMQEIKMKLVFLYYDYLQYKRTKLGTKLFKLDKKIHSLEVKYMGIEPTVVDWSNLEEIKHEETEDTNSKVVTEEIS